MPRLLSTAAIVAAFCGTSTGQQPAKVVASRVLEHEFRPTIEVLGDVETPRRVDIGSEIDGLVKAVTFEEGQLVRARDTLVTIQTKSAEIQRRAAMARLETAKQQLAEFQKGSRPDEVREAERSVASTRALLDEAEIELERERGLRESKIGSEKSLRKAQARAESLGAQLEQLQARLALVKKGPREEVLARARAQVAFRQAELDTIADEIARATIVAPFEGVVTQKRIEKGAYLRKGDAVASLVQLDPIRVVVPVPERHIARVAIGADQQIAFDAFPGETIAGRVVAVIPMADRLARAFPVHLRLANDKHRLLPGMVARLQLPIDKGKKALAVARDCLIPGARGVAICAIDAGDVARIIPVRTGLSDRGFVQVLGDVKLGLRVVLRGNEGLRTGQKLVVVDEKTSAR